MISALETAGFALVALSKLISVSLSGAPFAFELSLRIIIKN